MPNFTHDIRPLFRTQDVEAMRWLVDLSKYEDVKARAEEIYSQLAAGSMPCDGAWAAERVALFRQWINEGSTP